QGRFYASTGVELESIRVGGDSMELRIRPGKGHRPEDYVTHFIGKRGASVRLLSEQSGLNPRYVLAGDESYVRARVCGPGGDRPYPNRLVRLRDTCAWVQPVFTARPSP